MSECEGRLFSRRDEARLLQGPVGGKRVARAHSPRTSSELGGCRADHHRPGIHLGQRHLSGWPETPGELRPFRESGYLGAPRRGGRYDPVDDESHGRWAARWSPDGREIAFRSRRSGNLDLWVMPAEGGPARQLTSDPEPNYHVWWSPDGRRSPSPRTEAVTRRFG